MTNDRTQAGGVTSAAPERELVDEFIVQHGRASTIVIGLRITRWESQGLTTGQLRLMSALRIAERPLALNELAATMHVAPATITRMTTQLVGRKLIRRLPDPDDRRVIRVELTQTGRTTLSALVGRAREFVASVAAQLTEEELRQATKLMQRVADVADELLAGFEWD